MAKVVGSFRTQYQAHDRVHCDPGDPEKQLYSPVFDKRGIMHLEEAGKENLYDYIQSHADSVNIHIILKRFEQGDISVMQRVQGTYGDFTQFPTTFAGALNTLIAAEQYFDALPVDVRAKFGHNFAQFIASMDTEDFARSIGIDLPDPTLGSAAGSVANTEGQTGPLSSSTSAPASSPQTTPASSST